MEKANGKNPSHPMWNNAFLQDKKAEAFPLRTIGIQQSVENFLLSEKIFFLSDAALFNS